MVCVIHVVDSSFHSPIFVAFFPSYLILLPYSPLSSFSPFLRDLSSPSPSPSQFEITVEEEEYSILTHPVMKELLQQKWKSFVRVHFYLDLILYVIFLLTWTLLYAYPSVQEKYQYIFPRDVWRIIIEVFSAMMYILVHVVYDGERGNAIMHFTGDCHGNIYLPDSG